MKCTFCGAKAVFRRRHSGVALCKKCFIKSIENKVRWTIGKYEMLERSDFTMLAVSGGKDSVVMMRILHKIEMDFPEAELIAVTIDEGIPEYRDYGLKIARKNAEALKIRHEVFSFKEFYGYTLNEIVRMAKRKRIPHHACTYCGVLRRKILNVKGKELGVDKIATAHNLDDEAQTVLMNIVRGDIGRLVRAIALESNRQPGFIPRIKPMKLIPEAEIALYAYFNGIDFYPIDCPYARTSFRDEFRRFLNELEHKHPGVKYSIVSSAEKLVHMIMDRIGQVHLKPCKYCGEPTTQEICRACELLEQLGLL